MITLKEACKIIQKNYLKSRIIGCEDYNDSYGFSVLPRAWDGKKENLPCGSGPIMVDKTSGKITELGSGEYFEHLLSLEHAPEKLDVCRYLSDEDASYVRAYAEKLKKIQ